MDHLSSNNLATSSSGTQTASRAYYAYGTEQPGGTGTLPTDRTFTGQKQDGTGLIYLNARYYDPTLGTFLSPDTLVPDAGVLFDYNRFAYARLNPLKYTDPTGHYTNDEIMQHFGVSSWDEVIALFQQGGLYNLMKGWLDILIAAQDGDTISAWNAGASWTISGTFQRTASGTIEVQMGGGMAISEFAMAYYGSTWQVERSACSRDGQCFSYMTHAEGRYQLSRPMWMERQYSVLRRSSLDSSTLLAYNHNPCRFWDCIALGYDLTSLGMSFVRDTSPSLGPFAPIVGGAAHVVDQGATVASGIRTVQQAQQGYASQADLVVSGLTTGMSLAPFGGEAGGIIQLLWDFFDPFHPW